MFISQERFPEVCQIPLETPHIDKKVRTTNELKSTLLSTKPGKYLEILWVSSAISLTIISLILGPITRDTDYVRYTHCHYHIKGYGQQFVDLCSQIRIRLRCESGTET